MKNRLTNFGVLLICLTFFLFLNRELKADGLTINGYVSTYYATDNDSNSVTNRPFINSLNVQKNNFDINIAMISASYVNKDYRAKVTLHHGALARAAWPAQATMIQEANGGVRLADGLWLDAGYFLTHIGGEVITPKDNWLSSLALSTQNEPFFQSGMKLSYDVNDKLHTELHLLNGYNIFDDNNANKSIGWCAAYKANDDLSFSILGIYGNEAYLGLIPSINNLTFANTPKMLNNVVINYTVSKSLLLKVSADISSQEILTNNDKGTSSSLGGFLALRYLISEKLSSSVRLEMYNSNAKFEKDPLAFESKANGGTFGIEYKTNSNSYLRIEARQLTYAKSDNYKNPFDSRLEGIFSFGVFF
jgi:hypothetical protein